MKKTVMYAFMISVGAATAAMAQGDMKGMDMKGMDMPAMDQSSMSKGSKEQTVHSATGVVKKVDSKENTVTIAHEPVKSLRWPAMTMAFKVKDKALLDKLAVEKKADVQFVQQGKDYVVTSVK